MSTSDPGPGKLTAEGGDPKPLILQGRARRPAAPKTRGEPQQTCKLRSTITNVPRFHRQLKCVKSFEFFGTIAGARRTHGGRQSAVFHRRLVCLCGLESRRVHGPLRDSQRRECTPQAAHRAGTLAM